MRVFRSVCASSLQFVIVVYSIEGARRERLACEVFREFGNCGAKFNDMYVKGLSHFACLQDTAENQHTISLCIYLSLNAVSLERSPGLLLMINVLVRLRPRQ